MASREGLTSSEWVSRAWASRENFTWKSSVLEKRWSDGPESCEGWDVGHDLGRPHACAIMETSEAHGAWGRRAGRNSIKDRLRPGMRDKSWVNSS